jgi:hypothetical protein
MVSLSNFTNISLKVKYKIPNIELNFIQYNKYQFMLIKRIKLLKSMGYSDRKICKFFNENNIKTTRGNKFKVSSSWSIIKKYNRSLKRRKIKLGEIVDHSFDIVSES